MPDGSFDRLLPFVTPPEPPPATGTYRRYGVAAFLALLLHVSACLPFLWHAPREVPPSVMETVEIAPVPEPAAPQAAEAARFAEAVSSPPPDPAERTNSEPESATTPPPEAALSEQPSELMANVPPPEPLKTETPPPDPIAAEEPDLIPPPPPSIQRRAAPQPSVAHALPPPRPSSRPAQSRTDTAAASEAAPSMATAPPLPAAPMISRPPPSYIGILLSALERHKEYPAAARARRAEGVALLRFAIRRDGTVSSWRIEQSSGDETLDASVERMIRLASPLPPPPDELPGNPVELIVPVRFKIR